MTRVVNKEDQIMTEIPKNLTSIPQQPQQSQKVEQVKALENSADEQTAEVSEPQTTKEITEIKENPADRSGIKVDNIENDIKIYASNPELAEKALEVIELAEKRYEAAGVEDAELKALNVGKAFIDEFQK